MAIFDRDSTGAQQWKKAFPLFGNATNIVKGAFIKMGAVDGTNQGYGIIPGTNTSFANQFMGITEAAFAAATLDNDPTAGTKFLLTDLTINPKGIYLAKYDNALTAGHWSNGLAFTGSGTAPAISSGENLGGGWLFFDNFELHWVASSSSGTYTTKSALTSGAVAGTQKVAKIMYQGAPKLTLTTANDVIGIATAAQGAEQLTVLENFIHAPGFDWVLLDPTKHDGLILPSTVYTPEIWAAVQCVGNHFLL